MSGKFTRSDSNFTSQNTECAGWLYLPENVNNPPVIIMAHGFGCERTFKLPEYAKHFAENGFAVFLFDYRYYGDSAGEPRYLIDPFCQIEDWKAALTHVRSLKEVNTERIALWGVSYSGGHAFSVAAQDPDIKTVVAVFPYIGGKDAVPKVPLSHVLKTIKYGLRDIIGSTFFNKPYYVPLAANTNEYGIENTPGALEGWEKYLIPEGFKWENKTPARIALKFFFYNPVNVMDQVRCPTLVFSATEDMLTPATPTAAAVNKMPNAQLIEYPCNHFGMYYGEIMDKILKEETAFLKKHL